MSESQQMVNRSGENHPMYGRTGALHPMYGRTGALHPMYGNVPTNAFGSPWSGVRTGENNLFSMAVYVYFALDNFFIQSFPSRVTAAKAFGVSDISILRYCRSGKVFKGKYILRNSKCP